MTMRFLVDAQLPPALARWISDAGYQAEHIMDIAALDASDQWIWSYADRVGATLITKDQDFVILHNLNPGGAAVIWVRIGNTTKRHLLVRWASVWDELLVALQNGERLIEVN